MTVTPPKRPGRGLNLPRLVAIGSLIALLAVFYLSGLHEYLSWDSIKARRDAWREVVYLNRPAALLIFTAISVALMSASLPVGSILSIAAGALFDLWLGVAAIAAASAVGSAAAFVISRYLLRDFIRHWFGRWLAVVDRGIERDGARYLLMLRLSPVVPFFAVNALMGLTRMPLRTFVPVTFIGMLPSCFLYVMVGTQVRRINSPDEIVSWQLILLLSLLAVTPVLLGRLMRRLRKVDRLADGLES